MRCREVGVLVKLNECGSFVLVGSDGAVGCKNGDNLCVVW